MATGVSVIFDIDGVVLDWRGGFLSWLNRKHGHDLPRMPLHHSNDLGPSLSPPLSDARYVQMIREFSLSLEFSKLRAFDGAREFIQTIAESGMNICAVSSCGDGLTKSLRLSCLEQEVGWQSEWAFEALPLARSKLESYLALFSAGDVTIDDHLPNIKDARSIGLSGLWYKADPYLHTNHGEHTAPEKPITNWSDCAKKLVDAVTLTDRAAAKRLQKSFYDTGILQPYNISAAISASPQPRQSPSKQNGSDFTMRV